MVTQEEFGSLIAEYEGFRDTIFDAMSQLRQELEKLKEEIEDLRDQIKENKVNIDRNQSRLG
ncbi:hypothetical protein KY306_02815 [Candidatus Woesearchaeota archaeon]|nr:hypothetical protein [Candidatus Woesearchaeota archaeon]